MMPCKPAMMFWSIVGHASRQTAGPMGPSTSERSNRCAGFCAGAAMAGPDSVTVDALATIVASSASTGDSSLDDCLEAAARHPLHRNPLRVDDPHRPSASPITTRYIDLRLNDDLGFDIRPTRTLSGTSAIEFMRPP